MHNSTIRIRILCFNKLHVTRGFLQNPQKIYASFDSSFDPMAAPLVVPALRKHTATVIWAHGLGDRYLEGAPKLFGFVANYVYIVVRDGM